MLVLLNRQTKTNQGKSRYYAESDSIKLAVLSPFITVASVKKKRENI
jgi:hypothetical protein